MTKGVVRRMEPFKRQSFTLLGLPMICLALTGCPAVPPDGGLPSNFVDGNFHDDGPGEPNGDFANSIVASFDGGEEARLKGTVESSSDLDVFFLGPMEAGDRVTVEALAASGLDVSIGLFDAEGRLVFENDDRSSSNLDSWLEFVIRHDSEGYYLVVTRSAFAALSRRTGAYTVELQVTRGGDAPAPTPQVLFLKFDGGPVDSSRLGNFVLDPFDAGDISRVYLGETEAVKQAIVDTVRENYSGFDVTIVTSDAGEPGGEFSTIFFGGFNQDAFGIAENVDLYNVEFCDDAIIFTESFTTSLFSSTPTSEEMGLAIGNVAAHEMGHLLGLNHVDDDLDIMDDRSLADAFLLDQEFKESPLSTDIMPFGTQDGELLLDEIVGPSPIDMARLQGWAKPAIPWSATIRGGAEVVKRQGKTQGRMSTFED